MAGVLRKAEYYEDVETVIVKDLTIGGTDNTADSKVLQGYYQLCPVVDHMQEHILTIQNPPAFSAQIGTSPEDCGLETLVARSTLRAYANGSSSQQ